MIHQLFIDEEDGSVFRNSSAHTNETNKSYRPFRDNIISMVLKYVNSCFSSGRVETALEWNIQAEKKGLIMDA